MTKLSIVFSISLFFLFSNCTSQEQKNRVSGTEHRIQSALWFQRSAEMQAIYYQTFNMAKMVLDDRLMKVRLSKPAALIVDIDETMLDNSPYEAENIKNGNEYSKESWMEWTAMEKAEPLPGALDFMKHAAEKGVEVFYISNRYVEELGPTLKNLQKYNFPNADSAHVFLRKNSSDKTDRRAKVEENHVVLMLIGDNLNDFTQEFDQRGENLGFDLVEKYKNEFGSTFFVLPNPMYGEWLDAIYGNSYDLSTEEKEKRRMELLKGY